MKAPEKIFICDYGSELGHEWHSESEIEKGNNDIEYVRKDVFFKKAIEWIDYYNQNCGCEFDGWEEDFRKETEVK